MIEWLPMDVEAGHGCRALLRVRRLAWGAGGGDDYQVVTVTRVHGAGLPPQWSSGTYAGPSFIDGDTRLTGWLPESALLGLKAPPAPWPELSDAMIAEFWPEMTGEDQKADLRRQWRALEKAHKTDGR